LSHTISSTSQLRCVKASAADLISTSDRPSSRSSLKAGMTMEIFTARNVLYPPPGFNAGIKMWKRGGRPREPVFRGNHSLKRLAGTLAPPQKNKLQVSAFSACFFAQMIFTVGMTIWILALLLLAAAVALGHKLGAINAAFTFAGILIGGLLATVAGKIFKPLLPHFGIDNPTMIWALAPVLGFFLVLILFKMAGFFVHRKVEVFYKYKAGDLRLALWERLNARIGACVGVLNGTAYIVLASFYLFNLSYWTSQVATSNRG
jgi:hypothetical protein